MGYKMEKLVFLRQDEIEADFHDPYIVEGYRKPNVDIKTALKSCTKTTCNESFNVWSHGMAVVYFLVRFYNIFKNKITDPIYWPLLALAVGITFLFSMSTIAHALNSLSKRARHRCFYFDYAGISIYGIGTGQAFYFYCRQLHGNNSSSQWSPLCFIAVSITTSIVTTLLMCATRRQWCKSKALFRTLACALPFIVNSYPYFYRLIFCGDNIIDECNTTWLPLYLKHSLFLLLGAVANISKYPERRYPGRFDTFGQSHHFLHIFIFLALQNIFEFSLGEMERRMTFLRMHQIQPNIFNTLIMTIFGMLINLTLASYFNADPEQKQNIKKMKE